MIVIGYFLIASIVLLVWFHRFWNDTSTSKKDLISWVALLFLPLFWPLVLPFSLLQINSKKPEVEADQYDGES
ncbi:hypothetical protein CP500_004530 [Tychonema bourrellyi FEM_GT703]|uniref:Uncharacterized protein n=1 Tax=Tychonema bourrellyi FEM_GT703 TaxID=2040638 RepID=A0A2G4F4D2_9CYAN|nr:hypothetical protein CP500_004530 [Tychonema bourrellyi FEM_GT703]